MLSFHASGSASRTSSRAQPPTLLTSKRLREMGAASPRETPSPAAAIRVPRLRLLLAFGERGRPHGCFGRNHVPLAAGLEDEEPADAQLRLAHGEQPPFPPRLVLDGHLDHRGLPGLHHCRICRKLLALFE